MRVAAALLTLLSGAALTAGLSAQLPSAPATIRGMVTTNGEPVAGATVRVYGSDRVTQTGADGGFVLPVDGAAKGSIVLAAAKPGYYNVRRTSAAGEPARLELQPLPPDNPAYAWQDPAPHAKRTDNCGNCHKQIYQQWEGDGHARAALNPVVIDMFNGTDARGAANVIPGYRLDWADAGTCASCHAPLAWNRQPGVGLDGVAGVAKTGVSCDFCHKVRDVLPSQFPHVDDMRLLRPPAGQKLLFGPLDDAIFPKDVPDFSYAPVFGSSRFCAGCHDGSWWGTPIYETYTEWRNSPYARAGVECQQCHMKPTAGASRIADEEAGGILRPPDRIRSHRMMGDGAAHLLRSAARMSTTATIEGRSLTVTVKVANTGAGHDLPTGQPMRNLVLLVEPVDANGHALRLLSGERVPVWGGNYASRPGTGFAKVLVTVREYARSSSDPVGSEQANYPAPFWRRNRIASDNRIRAKTEVTQTYSFDLAGVAGPVTVSTRLVYRRAFEPLARLKGWQFPDVNLAANRASVTLDTSVPPR